MKKNIIVTILAVLFPLAAMAQQGQNSLHQGQTQQGQPQLQVSQFELSGMTPEEAKREVLKYQVGVAEYTRDKMRKIFDDFDDSFIDYEPAIAKINTLIYEYENAMHNIPIPIPEEGEQLKASMKKLLSRMEKYYVHCKKTGRQSPHVMLQLHQAMNEVSSELQRLYHVY